MLVLVILVLGGTGGYWMVLVIPGGIGVPLSCRWVILVIFVTGYIFLLVVIIVLVVAVVVAAVVVTTGGHSK